MVTGATGFWQCPKMWAGSTVVVIGGGPSLRLLQWDLLWTMAKNSRFIACNDAYSLRWPDICFFGDVGWHDIHSHLAAFEQYGGLKITPALECLGFAGLSVMERKPLNPAKAVECLKEEKSHQITWFGNTGVTAILLAAKLGAKRIVLLGFDMMVDSGDGKANWYHNLKSKPKPSIYSKFIVNAGLLAAAMHTIYPDVDVVNGLVAPYKSALSVFETMDWKEALLERD